MTTITDVAARIGRTFDLAPVGALSTAKVYWTQIRYIDDDLRIAPEDVTDDQDVTDDDADFIVEATRHELEATGQL